MTKVTIEEVARRLKHGEKLTIVDARAPHVWEESSTKAAGAIRIPPDDPGPYLNAVKPDAYAVIYCTWPQEASSVRVAQALAARGVKEAHPLIGGFDAWKQAHLPVEQIESKAA